MKPYMARTILALVTALGVSGCTDATITEPRSHRPALQVVEGQTECVGVLPPGTYHNVLVPEGASCTMSGAIVRQNVKALRNASLQISASQVGGNVIGEETFMVWVIGTTVEGSILVHGGNSVAQGAVGVSIFGGTVVKHGNIHVEDVRTAIIVMLNTTVERGHVQLIDNETHVLLQFQFNHVGRNLQVFRNTGPSPKFVSSNVVGERVQCFDNTPPFVGGPNVAEDRQGQCF